MKKLKKLLAIGLMAVVTLSVAACGKKDEGSKTLTFGTNAEFPPFEYVASSGVIGEFDGIDMAIAKQIADDQGKTAAINNMEFDSLLLALQNGQVDAVIEEAQVDTEVYLLLSLPLDRLVGQAGRTIGLTQCRRHDAEGHAPLVSTDIGVTRLSPTNTQLTI